MVIVEKLYAAKQREFGERLHEITDPRVVYVTDLAMCSHKRVMRRRYPLLDFRFEPAMLLGELVHAGLASWLTGLNSDGEWRPEVPVEKLVRVDDEEYLLKGRADLVYYVDGRARLVVEVKTGRDLPDNEPREHHVLQLQVYLELLDVNEGYLLYVTPERLVEHRVERARLDLVALVADTVRDRARPRYSWECRYCPFRRFCPYAAAQRVQRNA